MRGSLARLFAGAALLVGLSACVAMPKPDPDGVAAKTAGAAGAAADQTQAGLGEAASTPLRDFNLVRDELPPILVRAYAKPYDNTGLDTCPAIAEQVHQLEKVLGPDVDQQRAEGEDKDMFAKGASLTADAALDAVRSATTGFIPVRSWVRRFSGATRAEQQAKAVALAGSVRRGYLKALGQVRGCDYPAAPLKPGAAPPSRADKPKR